MKTSVLLLGCLLATASLAQSTSRREVWEWKDADGVTHYSDAPAPGARKIVLSGGTAVAAPPNVAPVTSVTSTSSRSADPSAPNDVVYDHLEIWSPEDESSVFGTDATVNVRIRMNPELQPDDTLITYLDNKQLGGENSLEHTLSGMERGAHSLTSVVFSRRGKEKIRSNSVVFYVKQNSSPNPATQGPLVRPPKPQPKKS